MQGLQIQYSKEIAKELGKTAVCLPGEKIEIGDIITFPNGKLNLFTKHAPLGSFKKISSLDQLDVKFQIEHSSSPDSYSFSSQNSIEVKSENKLDVIKQDSLAEINYRFSSKGAIYFKAIDCNSSQLIDITSLESSINIHSNSLIWENAYLVSSVTVAKKAFIVQSKSNNSEITLKGEIDLIKNTDLKSISTESNFQLKNQKGDLFIMDWSKNVTVFMELFAFKKKVFEQTKGIKDISRKTEIQLMYVDPKKIM